MKIQTWNLVSGVMTRRPIQKVAKLGQLGTGSGSRDLLLNFGTPLYIYKTAEDTNFKCGVWIDDEKSYPKHRKLWLTGTEPESRDLQRIQNAVASAVTQASWRSGATELRRELHWLPIRQRVQFCKARCHCS